MTSARGIVGKNIPTKSKKSICNQDGKVISQELTKNGKVGEGKYSRKKHKI